MQVIIIRDEIYSPVEESLPRKLAAIVHADVAGYSRLAGEDEDATHRRLKESLDLISSTVASYHGRVINCSGDAALAMFEAVVDAVSCAVAVQHDLAILNQDVPDNRKVLFRIGINLGDVIEDGGDIFGDGVNVAARLEGLAEPGGICVSEQVYMAVGSKLSLDYADIGEQEFKNIAAPVRAYQVHLKPGSELPRPSEQPKPVQSSKTRRWQSMITALVIILVVTGAATYWIKPWEQMEEPASVENMAYPLPDKPSIAVLPLDNMSDDASQDYFADGMTEDLITDLSKNPGLFVIARNSSFAYKGQQVKIRQVAEELGVRYVLEGSVRRVGDQVRINAQLIDATTGGHLWAERYDGSLEDIFALQDQVTQQIVSALKVSLTGEETAKHVRHTTDSAEAHDAFLQGWAHYKLGTPEDLARGIPFFEKAIGLDNNYGLAHAALASIFWDAQINGWAFDLGMMSFEIEERIEEHLNSALESPTPLGHDLQARIYLSYSLFDKAVQEAEKAVALDANDATAHAALANALILADRPAEGLTFIQDAMRLDPYYPPNYLTILGAAQFGLENYEEALITFERAVKRNPESEMSLIYLAATYGHLGRMREAEDTIEAANELRATLKGLGELSLESTITIGENSPFTGKIDFHSFGAKAAQERLRTGLSDIPALTWHYLIKAYYSGTATGSWSEIEGATQIDLATAKSFYDRGVLFVDVGNKAEGQWVKGRVSGAINLPWVDYAAKNRFRESSLNEILDKTEEVVFYASCTPDNCSPDWVTAKAVNWGYQKVYYFKGGAAAWQAAGYPIETDE
jgi:TolB-like protein/class 3 adenylate cyclase/rhodanese-related sulfurtransferase